MERVHSFAVDVQMRNEVKDYIIDYLKEQILTRAFQGQDILGYAEAKQIIEGCFSHMNLEFGNDLPKTEYINEQE